MPVVTQRDPYKNFRFRVEIDGIAVGGFLECSGLESETEVIEYREGSDPNIVRQLSGLTAYSNIVLSRGVTGSAELYQWRQAAVEGDIQRRDGAIVLLDNKGQDVARWVFRSGWPCRWAGPELNALVSEVAIETLEICHEGLEMA